MDKFTKINKKIEEIQDNNLYNGKYIKVVDDQGWETIIENDHISCLVYLRDQAKILLRREIIPSWQHKLKHNTLETKHLTLISGTIEDNETPEQCLRRELYEEAGIILNDYYRLEIEGPFFKSKGTSSAFYFSIVELSQTDFRMVKAVGDGSMIENMSNTVAIELHNIDDIKVNDLITYTVLDKFKTENNL